MFKTNTNSKIMLFFYFILLNSTVLFAQNNFFKTAENSQLSKKKEVLSNIKKKRVYSLDEKAMRAYLRNAPVEFKNNGVTIPLEIPLPDGTVETFNMVESPVLSPEIALQNPDIKTYAGNGTKNSKASIRLSLTSAGFNAIIINVGENNTVYFDSYSNEKNNIYFNYFSKDAVPPEGTKAGSCLVGDNEHNEDDKEIFDKKKTNEAVNKSNATTATTTSSGTQLRTFRLAITTTGEFTRQNGGTQASGLAAVVSYVNRINAVFRNELSVHLNLVSGTNLIYTDSATDPYASASSLTLASIQNTINSVLGNGNATAGNVLYDIGHLLSFVSGSGSGLAGSRVCQSNSKGRAYSLIGDGASYGLDFMDNLILHEMGHQFAMNHSFNSNINVCTTRNATTSVEPGAGTTIMSYGYICATDNYPEGPIAGTLLQYHPVNYEEAINFLSTIACQVSTATGNTPPVVVAPTSFTIPRSTPFALTGSATDANNDNLTYCWEGTNAGTIVPDANTINDTSQAPFFRTYPASTNPTRTYPALPHILNGTNQALGDKLPSVGVVTTHTLTVRDNNAAGGGVTNRDVTVTVDGNIGPFLITSNTYPVVNVLTQPIDVTWSVNGTNVATPTVNILLSIDGGNTFPYMLASNTPNDGTQSVTIPTIPNTIDTARIKVEAVGNIFFDISNANFTIRQAMALTMTGTNVTTPGGSTGSATVSVTGGRNTYDHNVVTNFTNAPYNILGSTLTTFSTITVPALPTGVTINSVSLNITNATANAASYRNEIRAALSGAYTLAETQLSTEGSAGLIVPNPKIELTGFPVLGGSINLRFRDTFNDTGTDATIAGAFINVNFTRTGYTYLWSNGATTPTISNLVAGTYSVTVSDSFGNQTSGSYVVSNNYSITASSSDNGTITPAGISTVARNGSTTYNFTPNSCFRISNVLVNGTSVGVVSSYTFSNVTTNQTIAVSFVSNASNNTTAVTACDSYIWNGTTYSSSGLYTGSTANCVTERLNLTITPSSFQDTTISTCDSYTWSNNSQRYTTSGTYTGTTTGCVTQRLILTITPSSFQDTTISTCDSYTWSNNSQRYTTSGTYTGTTTGCVTQRLILTITPNSFQDTTINACDSYVWNGTTYTASGIYTGATTNCVTQRLNLNITPSWDNVTAISACNFYIWADNNQTYTTSGVYTGTTTNCINEKLHLTITPSSENVTTISACDSYVWAHNNHTYTTSGVYTGTTTNCITEKLNLTITPSLENTTTISACDAYTWAENNQTYATSGVYTGTTTNCVTEKLNLTITPSSTITTTVTSFGNYAWANTGQTYTTSGIKTGTTTDCVAQLLNLTINTTEIPTGPLVFCAGATVATAVGSTSLKFYTAIKGGTVLAGTTALTSKTFYVTEMINGVESIPRVAISVIVNSLPATPTSVTSVDSRNICKYVGTANPVTFTAVGGTAFNWTVPAGATIITGAGTSAITVSFLGASTVRGVIGAVTARAVNTNGCVSAARSLTLTTTAPTAPTSLVLSNLGISSAAITKVGPYIGTKTVFTLTAPTAVSAAYYRWELPTGVKQISGGTSNTITIDFEDVPAGAASLPIRVYSVAGCGESIARTLTLTNALPTTPSRLVLTDSLTTLSRVSAYTGKTTALTLTTTPATTIGLTATSFSWVLPIGVNVVDGATEVADNGTTKTYSGTATVLTINLGGIAPGVLTIPMSVFAVNGTGTSSTARTLTLTSAAPATPGSITVAGYNNCNNSFSAQVTNVAGVDYRWSVSTGTIIGGQGTNAIVINPGTATSVTINVVGSNGTGTSPARILVSRKSTILCEIARKQAVADEFRVSAYPNPSSAEFTIESSIKGANVQVYDTAGRLIENRQISDHTLQIGKTYSAGVYNVIVIQGTEVKSLKVIKK